MQGQVVRAKKGERHLYRPIESGLCGSSAPLDIVGALLELYPFESLYIADLDAILDRGDHRAAIASIRAHFPKLALWLDAGIQHPAQCQPWADLDLHQVIGSEKMQSVEQFDLLASQLQASKLLLSLDFSRDGFLGPTALLDDSWRWPERTIVMPLAQVGSMNGPDFGLISPLLQRAGKRRLYAAGGVRHYADLQQLAVEGISGALVASALHDGLLTTEHLHSLHHSLL